MWKKKKTKTAMLFKEIEKVFLYGNECKCVYEVQCVAIIQLDLYSFI